jgi:hypothetical protein
MSRIQLNYTYRGHCGHDRMVVGFTTNVKNTIELYISGPLWS